MVTSCIKRLCGVDALRDALPLAQPLMGTRGGSLVIIDERTSSYSETGNCIGVGNWRKSRRSNASGECVEVGDWRKSSLSFANGNCVEVGHGACIAVRDTKQKDQPARTQLLFPAGAWREFTSRLQA
jgi:hypothetical protein